MTVKVRSPNTSTIDALNAVRCLHEAGRQVLFDPATVCGGIVRSSSALNCKP